MLPDDGSTIVWPGDRWPCFSASSIIALAMRSLTDPNGFWLSSLARMRTSGFGDSCDTSTSGVWPMRSSTLSLTLAMVSMSVCLSEPSDPNRTARRQFRTTSMDLVRILPVGAAARMRWRPQPGQRDGDGLLGDLAVDDAVAAQRRVQVVAEADDGVVPAGIRRLGDVGRARVRPRCACGCARRRGSPSRGPRRRARRGGGRAGRSCRRGPTRPRCGTGRSGRRASLRAVRRSSPQTS